MIQLSDYEWAVLREMAHSLLSNAVEHELPNGSYWEVSDTIVEHERKLLRKLSGGDVKGLMKALSDRETITREQYEKALEEFGIEGNTDEMLAANCWMLMYGPKIIVE